MENEGEMFNLLRYVKQPVGSLVVDKIYEENQIETQMSELFHDFVMSLVTLIQKTYMGDESTPENLRSKHFQWCWDKTIECFKKENIEFESSGELYEYFHIFIMEEFYLNSDKKIAEIVLTKTWDYLFDRQIIKTRSEIDTFLEIYLLFLKSLKKV
jgi:hypothetical protein